MATPLNLKIDKQGIRLYDVKRMILRQHPKPYTLNLKPNV
jgi:hypothetical protein